MIDIDACKNLPWEERVERTLAWCWHELEFSAEDDALRRVLEVIDYLNRDKKDMEKSALDNTTYRREVGYRLMALYNIAKSMESIAASLLHRRKDTTDGAIKSYFDAAASWARDAGDTDLESSLIELEIAASGLVRGASDTR